MKNIFIILALLLTLSSCGEQHRYKKHHKHTLVVRKYRVVNPNGKSTETADDDFLFWYLITSNNSSYKNDYYVYGSNVPVTDFGNVIWSRTSTVPVSLEKELDKTLDDKSEEIEVDVEDLSPAFQQEIDLNQEYFDGMVTDEMGDYETGGDVSTDGGSVSGRSQDEEEADNDNEADTDSDTDADASGSGSDSDGGSSDSGGSDGGGGGDGGGD